MAYAAAVFPVLLTGKKSQPHDRGFQLAMKELAISVLLATLMEVAGVNIKSLEYENGVDTYHGYVYWYVICVVWVACVSVCCVLVGLWCGVAGDITDHSLEFNREEALVQPLHG